ncbi:AraC-like protein [Paenibacillus cellulosilyticus]|uniref:AraC-like protein n=1 Tax=Paenibacillus cellulosilyticus TaxID=375489 RepID=A0A2V2YTJ5_9BACL|nr:helix-turn-helix domain-containing protein [Paenibacillus cellulosilyticus]PWW02879.1 AraC-like protein [Paenibacillus cellulosilyticus]QKS45792.1 helix-turn-helix transcriptional regulator [Paenibacillus cellulosilyticus]
MRIPIYSFRVDYVTRYSEFNPLLLFAQKYVFAANEQCSLRKCYAHAIILIESGTGLLELNGTSYTVRAGSLVYIPAGSVHRWTADSQDPMVHRCVYFDWQYVSRPDFQYQRDYFCSIEEFREETTAIGPELDLYEVIHSPNIQMWVSYFNALTPPPEILGYRNPWDKLQYNGAFQTFLHQYVVAAMKNGARDSRITRILSRMEQEPPEVCEQNLYLWASEMGLKKSRFHALFKADTGYSPNDYVKRLQFHRIAEELVGTNLSITDIAAKHGFSSIHYFSKAFRLATGMSPTDYRKTYGVTY